MAPTTRNQTKNESSTLSKFSKISKERRLSIWSKVDPTSDLTFFHVIIAVLVTSLILAFCAWFILVKKVNLAGRLTPNDINTFAARLEFLFRYQCLPAICFFFLICALIQKRFFIAIFNPMANIEHFVRFQKDGLQNSFEHYLLSFLGQIGLLCHLSSQQLLQYLPIINILFVLSRVIYYFDNRTFQSLGFFLSFFPSLIATSWNLYMLFEFLVLYGR